MLRKLKKFFDGLSTVGVVVAVILAILLVGVRLVGFQPYTVLSGSMEPAYHVGSLIYVKAVDGRSLQVGDPVTFRMESGSIVTHRVVELVPDEKDPSVVHYRTQGDANTIPDGRLLTAEQVIGKPMFTIPYLGFVSDFIQRPPGTYIVISGCLLLLILPSLFDSLIGLREEKKDEETDSKESN